MVAGGADDILLANTNSHSKLYVYGRVCVRLILYTT
jgi:hypothetical protein